MHEASAIYTIQTRYDSLSVKEKQIADFILKHPKEAVNPSIEELAERIGISESTVVRFAQKLGYSGYQRFRIALARETMPPAMQLFETELSEGDDIVDIVFKHTQNNLEATYALTSKAVIKEAAKLIASSRTLYLAGLGGSNVAAADAYHKFIRTGIVCQYHTDYHMQLMLASQAQPEDVAIIISHTGSGHDTLAIAEEFKNRNCPIIVFTSYPRSPLAKAANLLIPVSAGRSSVVAESFSARIITLVLIDILYIEILEEKSSVGMENLNKMRSVIAKRRI
ncbi:MAG TPA: MurR/RpiR family transcriptional regulator [Sphaerochaeta sp.]|nr:MurR/RpiR family transcriptional regulator [Sphaerochaeta sp.]